MDSSRHIYGIITIKSTFQLSPWLIIMFSSSPQQSYLAPLNSSFLVADRMKMSQSQEQGLKGIREGDGIGHVFLSMKDGSNPKSELTLTICSNSPVERRQCIDLVHNPRTDIESDGTPYFQGYQPPQPPSNLQ